MRPATTLVTLFLLHISSLVLVALPAFLPDPFGFAVRVIGIAGCFLRPVLLTRFFEGFYVLGEFLMALASIIIFGMQYVPFVFFMQDFPVLWVVSAIVTFIVLEALFFMAVSYSGSDVNLGYFGQLHRTLWDILGGFLMMAEGVAAVLQGMSWTMRGMAMAMGGVVAAFQVEEEDEEDVELQDEEDVELQDEEDVEAQNEEDVEAHAEDQPDTCPPPHCYTMPLNTIALKNDGKNI